MNPDIFDPEPDIGPDDNQAQLLAEAEGERRALTNRRVSTTRQHTDDPPY